MFCHTVIIDPSACRIVSKLYDLMEEGQGQDFWNVKTLVWATVVKKRQRRAANRRMTFSFLEPVTLMKE